MEETRNELDSIIIYEKPSRQPDSPFQFISNDPIVACVGSNGGTSNYDIFRGFADAVGVIYDSVVKLGRAEDIMVYPMAFAARHCIELGLKISIGELLDFLDLNYLQNRVSVDKSQIDKHLLQHSIRELTVDLTQLLPVDKRFVKYESEMETYLSDYYFDEKGDMFRYAESREKTPNLAGQNIDHVSLTQLYSRFKRIFAIFERFYYDAGEIYKEYRTGSYTAHLSRRDIHEIAGKLPDIAQWKSDSFNSTKEKLRVEYGISNKELSSAITIIKKVPEFSIMIGSEQLFHNIPINELNEYVKLVEWYAEENCNAPTSFSLSNFSEQLISGVQRHTREKNERSKNISDETLLCLLAFYVLADNRGVSEDIDTFYNHVCKSKHIRSYLIDKLCKKETLELVRQGMKICGQKSYLQTLGQWL